jgi:hypothetical protein
VVERSKRDGFAVQALARNRIRDEKRVQQLERHHLPGPLVPGAPECGHAADAVAFEQPVTIMNEPVGHPTMAARP